MVALAEDPPVLVRFVRKLRGGSQPIMVEASDGLKYVVKFNNNPQGPNVSFNEAMGTELYRAAGLPVPMWKPLNVTEEFLVRNPQCWLEMPEGSLKPEPGLCFGAQYLGREGVRLWEVLPRSTFHRIVNKNDFNVAWLLDICASHADSRQSVFEDRLDGVRAVFVDQGHMFSGPSGTFSRPHYRAAAYLDTRIYERGPEESRIDLAQIVLNLDLDDLWIRAGQLPKEWLTDSARRNFSACLCVLANTKVVQTIAELIAGFPNKEDQREFRSQHRERAVPDWLLRVGVQVT